uniref:Phosphatidylinositol phosphatidylcholine transfer protein sec14 cytosolic-like protein n=1 Tax=Triticum monococcum TaxID=4568 RepID=Q6RYE1_TRIMO|nr:phosphatidylinositol phosphatidylcholine transfer protein sec14 cytosolic-like protein [Triticum monococcum]
MHYVARRRCATRRHRSDGGDELQTTGFKGVSGWDPFEEDNLTLRRFLRTRGHNIGKASAMLLKYLAWKRAVKPRGFISDDEVHNQLAQEKVYTQGFDKMGRPMVYLFAARHFPRRDFDELKRYVVYQEKFAAVVDLKGWGYVNCDIKASVAGLDIIKNYYPEQLGQVFLVHVPFVFMAAWKLGCTFVDNNTKKKFVFIDDRDLSGTLRDVVDESQLPDVYGGKFKLQGYNHSSPPSSTCN